MFIMPATTHNKSQQQQKHKIQTNSKMMKDLSLPLYDDNDKVKTHEQKYKASMIIGIAIPWLWMIQFFTYRKSTSPIDRRRAYVGCGLFMAMFLFSALIFMAVVGNSLLHRNAVFQLEHPETHRIFSFL